MFCPVCKDEFRSGFTRCAGCNVDLVDDLSAAATPSRQNRPQAGESIAIPMGDFCGFFSLDEARHSRDLLREHSIRSEIAIREAPDSDPKEPIQEEYWLRVEVAQAKQVTALLDDSVACGECGARVSEDAEACSACGARFE